MQSLSCDARRHLSGNHVVPDEDEVDALVCSNAQRTLDALQVCCNVGKSGRLRPAVAAESAQTQSQPGCSISTRLSGFYVRIVCVEFLILNLLYIPTDGLEHLASMVVGIQDFRFCCLC